MKVLFSLMAIAFVSTASMAQENEVSGLVKSAICQNVTQKYGALLPSGEDIQKLVSCRKVGKFAQVNDYYTLLMPVPTGRLSCTATIGSGSYGHIKATTNCRIVQKR